MHLRDYIRVLRKRWLLLAICALLATAAAAAVTWRATPIYRASAQLFVATEGNPSVDSLNSTGQFTEQRVKSYAAIVNSPKVTSAVATEIGGGMTPDAIAAEVRGFAPPNTVLLNIFVDDPSPQRAQLIANAVSRKFSQFANQLEIARFGTAPSVKVTVVKPAKLPAKPISPRKTLNLGLGLLVGLALGGGAMALREALDTSVKDLEQVQRHLSLPGLGLIPYEAVAVKRPLILGAEPLSMRVEAFRRLRTNLQFLDVDHAPRSIVITSSVREEGKTTTAINLATALAQSGTRVVVIEADLRRPRMSQYLGVDAAVGLTSVLIGKLQLADAIQTWSQDGLDLLLSGPTPPNPSELLGSNAMAELLRDLEGRYDLVLIDAPPLLPVTDAAVLSTIASGAVVVARYGHTSRDQLTSAVASLRAVGASISGLLLTMTPSKGPDSYTYYYGSTPREKSIVTTVDAATANGKPLGADVPMSPTSLIPHRRGKDGDAFDFFRR